MTTTTQAALLARVITEPKKPEKNVLARARARLELGALAHEFPRLREFGIEPRPGTCPPASPGQINGVKTDHPWLAVLALLPNQPATPSTTWLRSITAILLEATFEAAEDRVEAASRNMYDASLALRDLRNGKLSNVEVVALTPPGEDISPSQWQNHLSEWLGDPKEGVLRTRISHIERALAFLTMVRAPRDPRPPGTGGETETGDTVPERQGEANAPQETVRNKGEDTNKKASLWGAGDPGQVELVAPQVLARQENWSKGPRRCLKKAQAAAIRATRQKLPGVELHPTQARAIRTALEGATPRIRAIAAAAIYIAEPAGLTHLYVAHRPVDIPEPSNAFWLTLQPFAVQIPNRVSPILPGPPDGQQGPAVASAVVVSIPVRGPGASALRTDASRHLSRYINSPPQMASPMSGTASTEKPGSVRATNTPLFSSDDIRDADAHFRLTPAPRRVTCSWLAGLQAMFCEAKHGGGTDLALAVRAVNDLSYRTPAHYRSISAAHASSLRQELIGEVLRWLTGEASGPPEEAAAQSGYLGSRRCPNFAEVAAWVGAMQGSIATPPRGRPTRQTVARWHNGFVGYTLQLLLWSLGPRMSEAALGQLLAHGPLILEDKGEVGGARIALLPPMAKRQRAHAEVHLRWVREYLEVRAPVTWFWLDEKVKPRPITPKWVHSETHSPFASNAHRHAFVTALRDLGIREDRVALLVGHRSLGTETGDPWSAMDPMPRPDELKAIEHHLARLGWRDMKGFVGSSK